MMMLCRLILLCLMFLQCFALNINNVIHFNKSLADILVNNCAGIDPDACRNVTELITSKGYPCEDHRVITEDGFILSVQRIPHGLVGASANKTQKPVVFLQHGLLSSAADFVANLQNESLAFLLADAGYDVWLGNFRGSTYSSTHIKYTTRDAEYWAWSWDQMSAYDLPAMIDLALNTTGQKKLFYIGHSEGTTTMFAQTKIQDKIHMNFALAPVAHVKHIKGMLWYFHIFIHPIDLLFEMFGVYDFLPSNFIVKLLASTICKTPAAFVCDDVLFLIAGFDIQHFNKTRLEVYLYHSPAGTSVQNIVHFSQMVGSGNFQMYNYGSSKKNHEHYGQKDPPLYYLSNYTVPTVLFHAGNDWLADIKDYQTLVSELPNIKGQVFVDEWNHLDFLWALDAKEKVYDIIMDYIQQGVYDSY